MAIVYVKALLNARIYDLGWTITVNRETLTNYKKTDVDHGRVGFGSRPRGRDLRPSAKRNL